MIRIDNSLLYDFQQKLLEVSKKNYMYPLDTGTGKTLLSLHHYWKWACGKQLLIVAPAQKVKEFNLFNLFEETSRTPLLILKQFVKPFTFNK